MDITNADFGYTTNHPVIVNHAKWCYLNYSTIVNNINKDSNTYNNTLDDFALLDNKLSASQTDIGESSNLAQIAQSYSYTFDDSKYDDYVAILSIIAQIAIDSSKRLFDVDVDKEISRIKKDMDVANNKYPKFWKTVKRDFKDKNINKELVCPMNYLADIKFDKYRSSSKTIPISEFIVSHKHETNRRKSKKVEKLIEDFSLKLFSIQDKKKNIYSYDKDDELEDMLLLRSDFDKLIEEIHETYISGNYIGLMSWLINRSFMIGSGVKRNSTMIQSRLKKNRPVLLKVLYEVNKEAFLACFVQKSVPLNSKSISETIEK